MQKVFRRTILAQKQHARRAVKRKAKNDRDWMKSQNEQNVAFDRENSARLKNERRNRREDWELGPLKPKRDVGDDKEVFGTMDYQALEGVDIYKPDVLKRLEPFGGKHLNIRKGDRVVILEGHDKGKIGILSNIDERKAKVTVEGLNRVRRISPLLFKTCRHTYNHSLGRCINT
jgi:large subunit ribosomal protein L24